MSAAFKQPRIAAIVSRFLRSAQNDREVGDSGARRDYWRSTHGSFSPQPRYLYGRKGAGKRTFSYRAKALRPFIIVERNQHPPGPLEGCPDHASLLRSEVSHRAPSRRSTIHALIIEDEALIAMLIEDSLRQCGFTSFDFAISTEDAIRLAQRRCPDLITADVELNPGSGIDAVDAICDGPPVPVVFVTGSPQKLVERMPDHLLLLKPFDPSDLIAIAHVALGRAEAAVGN
nr:response regulator [Novosphingobium sp. Gsoil 351]